MKIRKISLTLVAGLVLSFGISSQIFADPTIPPIDGSSPIGEIHSDLVGAISKFLIPADVAHFGATCKLFRENKNTQELMRKVAEEKLRAMDLLNNVENQKNAISPWGELEKMLASPVARKAFQDVFPPEELSKLLSLTPGPNVHTTFLEWIGMNGLANILDTIAEYVPSVLETRFYNGRTFTHIITAGGHNQLATLEVLKRRAPHLFTATDNIEWTPALTLTRFTPSSLPLLRFYAENFPETLVAKSPPDSIFKGRSALEDISSIDLSYPITSGCATAWDVENKKKIIEIVQAWESKERDFQ